MRSNIKGLTGRSRMAGGVTKSPRFDRSIRIERYHRDAYIAAMTHDPIDRFIEQMGLMVQEDGGPRIAGQILGYLLVEGEPRTLAEITEALGISKASASTNCRFLASRGVLERTGTLGSRSDSYIAVPNPAKSTLTDMAKRFRNRAETTAASANAFPPERAAARDRVLEFSNFFRASADFVEAWANQTAAASADADPAPESETTA